MTESERYRSAGIDKLVGVQFPVLDQGFVRVVDYMGGDASIVQAARVSYGAGTKTVRDDRDLIRYLMRHRHSSPFEMVELKLHVKAPMDVWRQWIRHRTASVNEYSTRYSEAIDATMKTEPGAWRKQSTSNKQGSGDLVTEWPAEFEGPGDLTPGAYLSAVELGLHNHAREVYETRLRMGVAREQARKDLPLSTYTEAYWKIDGKNLLDFLSLRMDSRAQLEIRSFANAIGDIVEAWLPLTWEAFRDYRLEALTLTGPEICALRRILRGLRQPLRDLVGASALRQGIAELCEGMSKREVDELVTKLNILGQL